MASPAAPKGGAVKRQQTEAAPDSDSSGEELMPPVPVPRKQAARKNESAKEKLASMEPIEPEEGTVLPPLPKKGAGQRQAAEIGQEEEGQPDAGQEDEIPVPRKAQVMQEPEEGELPAPRKAPARQAPEEEMPASRKTVARQQAESEEEGEESPVPRKAVARQQIEEDESEAHPMPKRQAKPLTFSAAEQRAHSNIAVMKKMQTAAAQAGIPVQKNPVQTSRISGKSQETDRVPSGIPGLDELLGGGFEKTSTVIVTGDPGCGKTTFLSQFLYNGATQYGDPGVMLSFEEQRDSIFRHMKGYGFDFAALEKQGMFATINYRPHEVKKLIDEGGGLILDTISSIGAKRLAIDSLTSYAVLFESAYQMREAELLLFEFLSKWKCTTMMSAEGVKALRRKTSVGTASLADGVIMLHHPRHKALRYRALEVLKMRGTRQSEKLCPFEFVEGVGIKVYPNEEIFYRIKEKEA
ncbi:MAG: ATPase domain-containing protein [Candidatus Anstonellaceae archaeon]